MDDGRIYLTWETLGGQALSRARDYEGVKQLITETYPGEPVRRIGLTGPESACRSSRATRRRTAPSTPSR